MEKQEAERSHLFLVRIWLEELGDGATEWRGRAQNITTGQAVYFRDWNGLAEVLLQMVQAPHEPLNVDAGGHSSFQEGTSTT
jgi:hypothetical protein